jgi:hypothetical protein
MMSAESIQKNIKMRAEQKKKPKSQRIKVCPIPVRTYCVDDYKRDGKPVKGYCVKPHTRKCVGTAEAPHVVVHQTTKGSSGRRQKMDRILMADSGAGVLSDYQKRKYTLKAAGNAPKLKASRVLKRGGERTIVEYKPYYKNMLKGKSEMEYFTRGKNYRRK